MAFKSLASRFGELPLVLAGPILRQVTKDAVTVWVALQQSATITLTVYDSDQPSSRKTLMTANRATTAVGKNLHIVAVTARNTAALSEGHIYFYDLTFTSVPRTLTLSQAVTAPGATPVQDPFSYAPFALPSFALPPKDLTKLRLIHGSCRKPHGEGPDALAILDGMIREKVSDPFSRPHQLVLSGDQIYADDVADALLLLLTDAGEALLGWAEALPMAKGPQSATALPPYLREEPLQAAGFTSDDLRSQLMSLGEYFAMYLFAWSEVLWPDPKTALDTFKEIFAVSFPGVDPKLAELARELGTPPSAALPKMAMIMAGRQKTIEADTANVETFRSTVSTVRLALANIPSYMICDDHEVTDDWNMTRRFCQNVYGGQIGVRVVQNALIAFAVCQSWGNLPEQFAVDTKNPPGQQLLQILQTVSALPKDQAPGSYAANAPLLMTIVGVHTDAQIRAKVGGDYGVFHEGGANFFIGAVPLNDKSLRYNFSIEGDSHQVIVTDTRSWRSFPESGLDTHAELLPVTAQSSQIELENPPLGNRLLLVVVTTNIPPTASIRAVEDIAFTKAQVYENDLLDSWEFPSDIYDRLIVRLSQRVDSSAKPNAPVIFLSGDVHFSFSSRLAYWADQAQFGDPQGQGTKTKRVYAQLVASSLKNEIANTRGMQSSGYTFHPAMYQAPFVPPHVPEGLVGWNVTQKKQQIGTGTNMSGDPFAIYTDPEHPTFFNFKFAPTFLGYPVKLIKPDYRYRLDYLTTSKSGQVAPAPPTIPPINGTDAAGPVKAHVDASNAYVNLIRSGANNPDCIGHNNLGEIGFSWNATKGIVDRVYHTLRWQRPNPIPLIQPKLLVYAATYDISTDIDDTAYPPIKAPGEP